MILSLKGTSEPVWKSRSRSNLFSADLDCLSADRRLSSRTRLRLFSGSSDLPLEFLLSLSWLRLYLRILSLKGTSGSEISPLLLFPESDIPFDSLE